MAAIANEFHCTNAFLPNIGIIPILQKAQTLKTDWGNTEKSSEWITRKYVAEDGDKRLHTFPV